MTPQFCKRLPCYRILTFTWDPDNDPDQYVLRTGMKFISEDTGTYDSVYVEEGMTHPTVHGTFELIEGRLDTDSPE